MAERACQNSGQEDEFLRSLTFPEEERAQWTSAPWRGEFRWFRSPNVIPLEKYRAQKAPRAVRKPGL